MPMNHSNHLQVLDGWRAISILLVLAAHLLPLGPKSLMLNSTAGVMGMSLFFILSGFLITSFLLKNTNMVDFISRRFFRIVPLAWLYIVVVLVLVGADAKTYLSHLFFYANLPPVVTIKETSHFWSLCLEIQFYVLAALIVLALGRRGLMILPLLCLAVTGYRIFSGVHVSVVTYYRLDEILAGCCLALVYRSHTEVKTDLVRFLFNPYIFLILLVVACHPASGWLNYFRPYFAMLLVGSTLMNKRSQAVAFLQLKSFAYIATISYALYVFHGGLRHTWLGEGDTMEKYLKRPLLFAVTFFLAHISTFYYEKKCTAWGRIFASKLNSYFHRGKSELEKRRQL